ncbi:uncharacterized protein LOC112512877 [Cynara cardunculus var. scolymus]|uniref:uncharacterized protein LOC112512877 n=1 Tax=Cynara cardunculus var. scolymus TaxID=59895 RepID=UPI000D630910|nr:uncharacterized protein LOC112512877 [Cynara cardunculus var. scolymus]
MINFYEGLDLECYESILNGPYVPITLIPRNPAAGDTVEVPARHVPKLRIDWDDEDRRLVEVDQKAKRLLIMALPNEIFQSLDACEFAKDLWDQLANHLEGGIKMKKNRRAQCLNEYNRFQALPDESLEQTYHRFNTLINKCRKCNVTRTQEENNMLFLKRLHGELENLSISFQENQDLE